MNTGGPAIPVPVDGATDGRTHDGGLTLLDWFAGQALVSLSVFTAQQPHATVEDVAGDAYDIAEAMLAEKAHREEAMRSALERPGVATATAVHKAFHGNHSPDAGKMAKLEALNRELVEALEVIVSITDRDHVAWIKARAVLAKSKEVA